MSASFLTQELEVLSHEILAVLSDQEVNSSAQVEERGPMLPPGDSLCLESQDLIKKVASRKDRLQTCLVRQSGQSAALLHLPLC